MSHSTFNNMVIAGVLAVTAATFGLQSAMGQSTAAIMQSHGNVYATGGVGAEEQAQFEALGSEYNLRLTMARPDGSYLNDVQVSVLDAQGAPVLEAVTTGPFLYAQLPQGSYTVQASLEGRVQEQTVDLTGGQPTELKLTW